MLNLPGLLFCPRWEWLELNNHNNHTLQRIHHNCWNSYHSRNMDRLDNMDYTLTRSNCMGPPQPQHILQQRRSKQMLRTKFIMNKIIIICKFPKSYKIKVKWWYILLLLIIELMKLYSFNIVMILRSFNELTNFMFKFWYRQC